MYTTFPSAPGGDVTVELKPYDAFATSGAEAVVAVPEGDAVQYEAFTGDPSSGALYALLPVAPGGPKTWK